ncbi:hypothetical protein SFR_2300 [Streptomyces sp. FR-008]|nr:hypothetical protein SFR_2300 [Streptomyces sp. FR-008]
MRRDQLTEMPMGGSVEDGRRRPPGGFPVAAAVRGSRLRPCT